MGRLKVHLPVKLAIGCIFQDDEVLRTARAKLVKKFGSVDFESDSVQFTHTDYYTQELGEDLKRRFISFRRLIRPDTLPKIKTFTNYLEQRLSLAGNRRINLDPGYLELSKFILATTNDFKHRIWLGAGVFAEVTLYYQDKSFRCWEWTYPDYRTDAYIQTLNRIRAIYVEQIKGH